MGMDAFFPPFPWATLTVMLNARSMACMFKIWHRKETKRAHQFMAVAVH